ncbi:MAG: DUF885 domain-containing protein [Thermoplasmata archaeon]
MDHLFTLAPGSAVTLGLHDYDGRLPDLSPDATERWTDRANTLLRRLREVPSDGVSPSRRYDRTLLEMSLESPLFDLQDSRDYDQNPMVYLTGLSLTAYTVRAYAPLPTRIEAIHRHLSAVPAFLSIGLHRLDPEVPAPFVRLAIGIARGIQSNYRDVEPVVRSSSDASWERVREVRDPAVAAVQAFAARLEKDWLPRATNAFALGPERYQKLLWVRERVRAPFADILAAGRADLERNQTRLRTIAAAAQPPTDGPGLLDRAAKTHPTSGQLIARAREFVEETKLFVREKELATIPEPADCRVEETPAYHREMSTASMNPPGPFDAAAEGMYFVTPVDPAWTPETQDAWLRSFNDAVLRNVTVHEVYPGHYLQFLHLRRSVGSLARKTFQSNAFTEGWAHYAEQLVVEQGLGAGAAEAEAAQLYDALLRDCRLIASVGLHTQGMSIAEATAVFEREGYNAPIVAQREAGRGTYDPSYLGYTLGKLAILDARAKHLGPQFGGSLRAFHDRVLSFGAPPVGFLDELLRTP